MTDYKNTVQLALELYIKITISITIQYMINIIGSSSIKNSIWYPTALSVLHL